MKNIDKNVLHIENIIRYCVEIEATIRRFGDFENYANDIDYQKSCALSLQQIGESVKKLSDDFKNEFDGVAWRQIAGIRDVITHDYGGIDIRRVWRTLNESVPHLLAYCSKIIEERNGN